MTLLFRKFITKDAEPDNTGRYLITYADLITLLLGLFVILYATSQVDKDKFKEFSQAFSRYFKTDEGILEGTNGILDKHLGVLPEPIVVNPNARTFEEITSETENALKDYLKEGSVSIKKRKGEIVLTLSENLLFPSAGTDIRPQGFGLLDSLSAIFQGMALQIMVDGHTDSAPIKSYKFESNWHLSTARATNVAYYLISRGVPEENMVIRGFGSQRPVAGNTTPEGMAKNRRVEISISELPQNALTKKGYED